jgi:tetratricopeptide (TPR) repeat protein/TolB-like protein
MSSIIEGYNYDIFISYRQKDNKYDGWVTEFVDNLKRELEATFKEDISVYFDINPHDGLLETYDVDASLKEKLKCLVFIPVLSLTYCDTKSFAWEHEFKAFVEQASEDQFGLKVKLPNGNVAGRVLPVRIHDLDSNDLKLCESVTGGVLRGIEFIYKTRGVNRPLRSEEENPHNNLNNTIYRDQINKVALAIKEIIIGIMAGTGGIKEERDYKKKTITEITGDRSGSGRITLSKKARKIAVFGVLSFVVLLIMSISLFPEFFKGVALKRLRLKGDRISVAVMPFQNMTNDSLWNIWQDGIQDNLITFLSNSPDLQIRHKESVNRLLQNENPSNYASVLPSIASIISRKLDADVFISGSINQAGTKVRLNAQLIDSKTDDVFKSFQIDGPYGEMFYAVDSLSSMVMDFLVISKLVMELPSYLQFRPQTTSPEAYKCYLQGESARSKKDYQTARKMFAQALSLDSNYTHMKLMLSAACMNQGLYEEARVWGDKAYAEIDQMPIRLQILTNSNHAYFHETPVEENKYLRQFLEIDDQFPGTYYDIGLNYISMLQYDNAIPEFEKALKIYDKLGIKPWWIYNYTELGYAYFKTGQYKKEEKIYIKAEKDFPNESTLTWRQAIHYLTTGDTAAANKYLKKYITIYKDNSWPEAALARNLGWAYSDAGMQDKAEESFRQAISIDPENGYWYYYLAYHLIDKGRNIDEGLDLVDKALELNPGNEWFFLDCKGWGLYKKGNSQEALRILERSWKMQPVYNHEKYLHLDEVRKAVASYKNN